MGVSNASTSAIRAIPKGTRDVSYPVLASSGGAIGHAVDTIAALRGVAAVDRCNGNLTIVLTAADGKSYPFMFSDADTTADDGVYVVKPTDIAPANPGRWLLVGIFGIYAIAGAAPALHAASHVTGGDQIATFASGVRGLVPAPTLPADAAKALLGNATWGTPANAVDADTVDGQHAAAASSVLMEVRVATIYRLGSIESAPIWKYETTAVAGSVLKRGPGRLHAVINGDNAAASITLYDAVTATNAIMYIDLSKVLGSLTFDIDFYNGLTYTTTGSPKVLIAYE